MQGTPSRRPSARCERAAARARAVVTIAFLAALWLTGTAEAAEPIDAQQLRTDLEGGQLVTVTDRHVKGETTIWS